MDAFNKDDLTSVYNVEPLEQVIDGPKAMLRDRHIVRLADGECTVEAGFIWGRPFNKFRANFQSLLKYRNLLN